MPHPFILSFLQAGLFNFPQACRGMPLFLGPFLSFLRAVWQERDRRVCRGKRVWDVCRGKGPGCAVPTGYGLLHCFWEERSVPVGGSAIRAAAGRAVCLLAGGVALARVITVKCERNKRSNDRQAEVLFRVSGREKEGRAYRSGGNARHAVAESERRMGRQENGPESGGNGVWPERGACRFWAVTEGRRLSEHVGLPALLPGS